MNPLTGLISFSNDALIIPFVSLTIVIALTHAENYMQFIIKCVYFVPSFTYAIRGVLLTAILANIDSKSRILYKLIASRIACGNISGYVSRRFLMFILEDISSRRNHISLKGYLGSTKKRRDTMFYILAIGQFVMLLINFSHSWNRNYSQINHWMRNLTKIN